MKERQANATKSGTKAILYKLLETKRPHGGLGEIRALNLIQSFVKTFSRNIVRGSFGLSCVVGELNDVLYASHVDTVHRVDGKQAIKEHNGIISLADTSGSCLGADDGAGVYVLLNLIRSGIPGLYCFFVGEECGGIGVNKFDVPDRIKRAFEFDRRGEMDIIINHGASDTFGNGLANLLGMRTSTGGSYTDIASMDDSITERVNIASGYQDAHSSDEYLNTAWLDSLIVRWVSSWEKIHALPLVGYIRPKAYTSFFGGGRFNFKEDWLEDESGTNEEDVLNADNVDDEPDCWLDCRKSDCYGCPTFEKRKDW